MIKALIFDFNGTIDNIKQAKAEALKDVVKKIKPSREEKDLEKEAKEFLVTIERTDLKDPMKDMLNIFADASHEFFGDQVLEDFSVKELYRFYKDRVDQYREIAPDFLSVLNDLEKNYKLFILSHSREESIERVFSPGQLDKFNGVYLTQNYGMRKPNVEIYDIILEENDLEPEECVMIGDDSLLDLFPAKVAGLKTVLFSSFVDGCISGHSDLDSVLDSLEDR